jgi:hypothetical protein
MIYFLKKLKDIINKLANIEEVILEKDLVEQILNFLLESMESLSNILLYRTELFTLNDLIVILLHDKAKKELRRKRIDNEELFFKTKFGKIKNRHEKNNHKGPITKHEGNYNFCKNPNHWMCNEIKRHSNEHEGFKTTINMIIKGSGEEVDNFQNDINALAINVLELNLCQYSNTFDWFVNNGMSKHVTRNNKLITNIKDDRGTPKIKTTNGIAHLVIEKGNLVTPIGKNVEIKEEILCVLGVNSNLYLRTKGLECFLTLKMFS